MKSNPPAHNREGIRLKVLWPLAALMMVVLIAAIFAKSSSGRKSEPVAQSPGAVVVSNATAAAHEKFVHPPQPAQASQSNRESEIDGVAAILFDNNSSLQLRRQAARALASSGTEQALAALKSGLTNNLPAGVKAAIAESLGDISIPEATALLHELANGKDETIARGAERGLAARGDADAANTLGTLLFNNQTPLSVRTEAALALGDVNLPAAQDLLTRAINEIHDEDVLESALDGMGRRPFSDTEEFFRNYLNSPNVSAANKVLAIEAVQDADGNVAPFLSNYVNNPNAEVRAAAKDALEFLAPPK